MSKDFHTALKTEIIQTANAGFGEAKLAKLQWGKNDIGFSLHINPSSFSTYGLQMPDLLHFLGFEARECSFITRGKCYAKWVDETFDVQRFAGALENGYGDIRQAEKQLDRCGFILSQPEGWAHFFGRRSYSSSRDVSMRGDGHMANQITSQKQSEDDTFLYRLTWVINGDEKGWVFHYRPKHSPTSVEIDSVFKFLQIKSSSECPEFDFEPCYWRSISLINPDRNPLGGNAQAVHTAFDAHQENFSPGIERLLKANATFENFGFSFLPQFPAPATRMRKNIEMRTERPNRTSTPSSMSSGFDVAISFAGTERQHAEKLATILKNAGYSVFYDNFYQEELWGKNLVDTFDQIYRKDSKYCVMFISAEYVNRIWTNHERQSAQARALQEKGNTYILPIRVDDTELSGMPPTIGYVPISQGIEKIAELLIKKLQSN